MLNLEHQDYQKNIQKFRAESATLAGIVGESFAIHHVGSTVIPNMSGKNILDILIGAPNNASLTDALRKLEVDGGYFSSKSAENGYVFLASRIEETGSGDIHLHLTLINSERYNDFLHLKKYLLENPVEAREYGKVKSLIAKKVNHDRSDYRKEKSEYVASLLQKARRYHEQQSA